jgi:hypothetical protein
MEPVGHHSERGRPLTPTEVRRLPGGARITVTWSGGNGPHDYVVRWWRGDPYAITEDEARRQPPGWVDVVRALDFIGPSQPRTQVWRRGGAAS